MIAAEKTCKGCGRSKPATLEFFYAVKGNRDGLAGKCRECIKSQVRANTDPVKNRARARAWRNANPERYSAKLKEIAQRPEVREHRRKQNRAYLRKRRATDPIFRLTRAVGSTMRKLLRTGKGGRSWHKIAGYTADALRSHLEAQFIGRMTWKNYGRVWHVDHILPIAYFRALGLDGDDLIRTAWALTNLRPLAAKRNIRKGARREHLL